MREDEVKNFLRRGGGLILPIGLPGAGKSTAARQLVAHGLIDRTAIIRTDALRKAVGGRREWLGDEQLVFRLAGEIAAARLRNGLTVYLDATNIAPSHRERALALAGAHDRAVLVMRFSDPPDLCRGRRASSGVAYADDVWNDLVAHLAEINWAHLPVPWVDASVLDQILSGDA